MHWLYSCQFLQSFYVNIFFFSFLHFTNFFLKNYTLKNIDVQTYFRRTSRELKRLDAISRSPICNFYFIFIYEEILMFYVNCNFFFKKKMPILRKHWMVFQPFARTVPKVVWIWKTIILSITIKFVFYYYWLICYFWFCFNYG